MRFVFSMRYFLRCLLSTEMTTPWIAAYLIVNPLRLAKMRTDGVSSCENIRQRILRVEEHVMFMFLIFASIGIEVAVFLQPQNFRVSNSPDLGIISRGRS